MSGRNDTPVEEISFYSAGSTIVGTLYKPEGEEQFPAVAILGGSDRGARGPKRIMWAKFFASLGFGAFVYDSPGTGYSTGDASTQTRNDRLLEAVNVRNMLRAREDVLDDAVGFFGGSEGGDVALLAAAAAEETAFVIAASSASGTSVLDILRYSTEKRGAELGLSERDMSKAVTMKLLSYAILAGVDMLEWPLIEFKVRNWPEPWNDLMDLAKRRTKTMTDEEKTAWHGQYRAAMVRFRGKPWLDAVEGAGRMEQFIGLPPERMFAVLESGRWERDWYRGDFARLAWIKCPVLALWGEEDVFLPPHFCSSNLRRTLTDAGNPDITIRVFPGLNHSLMHSETDTNIAEECRNTIATWLRGRIIDTTHAAN